MPRTIHEGFIDFLPKLTATAPESEAAKKHRASIKRCLENKFGVTDFFRAGSFGNGTNISGYSDVDYVARIPTENLKQNSGTTLSSVRDALADTFPSTAVRVNCPAIKVPFGTYASETTEVVPADYIRSESGFNVYEIADCEGGWKRTSPGAHNAYVRHENDRLGGKVKPLIRFIKAWKFFNSVPISSFYLEMRAAKYAASEKSIVYDIDVYCLLQDLYDADLAKMQDPQGVAGYIVPCSTQAKLEESYSKLKTAVTRASNARQCERDGDTKGAFSWWDLLYASRFPSYYK